MKTVISFKDFLIRTEILPGDLGYVIYLHGKLYKHEFQLKEEKPAHHPFDKDVIEQRYELKLS